MQRGVKGGSMALVAKGEFAWRGNGGGSWVQLLYLPQSGQWMERIVDPIQRHTIQEYSVQFKSSLSQTAVAEAELIGLNIPAFRSVGLDDQFQPLATLIFLRWFSHVAP